MLSTAYRYGSGFPFPGYLREAPEGIFVASDRNRFGPDPYSRWDVRGEKRFAWGRVTIDLFLEVANVLDHENERYNEIDSVKRRRAGSASTATRCCRSSPSSG